MQSEQLRTRKPLSDCTNRVEQLQSSQSSTSLSLHSVPTKTVFDSIKAFTNKRASNLNTASVGSTNAQYQNPSSVRRRPPTDENARDIGVSEVFEPQTVYIRTRSANKRSKGKEVAEPLSGSSPSLLKTNPTRKSTVVSRAFTEGHATEFNIVGSSDNENTSGDGQNQNSSSTDQIQLSTPFKTPRRSTPDDVFEPQTVYTRRGSSVKRSKGKEVAERSSGSCGKRFRSAGEQKDADGSICISKRQRVPHGKKSKDTPLEQNASQDSLDAYIKEQRAYFEDIDAEELAEESE